MKKEKILFALLVALGVGFITYGIIGFFAWGFGVKLFDLKIAIPSIGAFFLTFALCGKDYRN